MGNTFKRFLALALAVFMVIGMMPTNIAFATEDEATPCEHGIIGECADCLAGESKDEDIPEPGDGEETPEPGEGEETPEPGDGEETPEPGEGEETPVPGEGEETPNPDEGVDPAADDGEEQDGEVTPITGTITENMVWEDGAVIGGVTISGNVTITVQGKVTVVGTIRLAPDAIINVTFNGENGKLIRGGDFTGQMFYAEGVSGNFQNLTFNNITLDGGAVWTGDVDATLNRGTTNSGVKATGSVLYLVYANAVLNNSTLQNHDDSTGEKANAVFLRYYSTIEFNNSVVTNNNSISTYYRGGVITVRQGGTAKTNNSVVCGNSGASGGFFGISSTGAFGGVAEAYNSKFYNNYAGNGAVFLMQCDSNRGYLKIDGCEFYNNASPTAVLTEWSYSRPFIISNSYFHDNECAVWDCHADPVLDLSGKIVVKEDPDYTKYLFETPLVLTGALAEGSSIPVSEASRAQLMKAGYVVSGSADYKLTDADLAKFKLPEGYSFVLVDVNADNVFDAVPVNTVVTPVTVILKDSLNEDASVEQTVYEEIASRPVCEFVHEGLVFAGWIDTEGNTVGKKCFTETVTLTATWKIEVPKVTLGRKDQGANANTLVATVTNQYDSITYTYQWYKADEAIEGATSAEYTITESNTYKCVVTASFEGLESVTGSKSNSADLKEIPKNYVAQVGADKFESLKAAVEAANAIEGGATVTLLQDVTLGEALAVTGNVTISGGKITRDAAYTGTLFEVASGATLTLDGGLVVDGNNNWSIDANNVVSPEAGKPVATGWMIINGGTLNVCNATLQNQYSEGTGGSTEGAIIARSNSVTNLEGATIQHFYAQDAGSAVRLGHGSGSCNGAVLNIGEGTNITGNIGDWNGSLIIVYGSNTINMTGGTIKNNVANSNGTLIMLYGINSAMNMSGGLITENKGPVSAVYMHSSSKFVMTGGEISKNTGGTALYVRSNAGSVSISGDSKIVNNAADIWVSTSKTDDVNISGGSYTMDVSKWLAPGYGLIHDEETGIYTVTDHIYNLYFRDPVTNEQLSYIGPLQGGDAATLVATGKLFYADYYKMELEVLADARIDAPIIIDYPMTVNLNGHTLIADENVYPVIRVQGGADVTVTGNGSIVNATDYVFVLGASDGSSAGNLTIENGTFKGQTTIASVTKGQLTINGGSFECTESEYGAAYMLNCVDAGYNDGSAKITVKGGTFVGFNPENNTAEGAGTNFVAEGYIAETKDEGTTYTVRKTNYVAEVNGVKYESLTEALNVCTNGETVKLIADITYDADDVVYAHGGATGFGDYDQYNPSIVYIGGTKGATDAENQPSKVNAVLNLNGHTITNNADAYLFLFMDNCKITFTGEGTVQGTTDAPLIWSTGTETVVTIEGGKYTGTYGSLMWATHSGDLVIKGGEFSTTAADASGLIMRNSKDRQNSKFFISGKSEVTVTGGTFKGFNPEKMRDDSKTPAFEFNAVAKGYKAVDNGDSTWSVVPNMIFEVHLTDANGEPHWLSPLRSNDINAALEKGKIWYDSLQGTYNFTLKILEDCELDESVVVNFPLTFDLNGKTIAFNADSGSAAVNVSSTMTLVDSSAEQTGKIVRNSNTDCSAIAVAGGNLTVKSGTIASSHKGIQAGGSGKTNTITITGGVIDATSAALNLNKGTNTVSITGGKLSAENAVHAASNNGDIIAEFTISGGEFVGNLRDIEVGELSITGGTFTVDPSAHVAKGYKAVDNGNGTWSVVPKVYVAQVGETKFETLSEAIEAAKAADTAVTVLKTIVLTEDGTLDLQGVRLNAGATLQNAPIFRVLANVTVTNGIVDGRGPTAGEGGINCYAFIVGNSETAGTLNIADGTYRGVTSAISITNGVVNISGGTFQAGHDNEGADYGTTYLLNCVDAAYKNGTAKYNITGGKFVGFNPENNAAEGEGTNFLSGNYKASDYYGDNKWYVAEANVQLDENKYFATIKDALGTLSSADTTVHTVKILADLEIDVNYSTYNYPILVNGFAIELDLNGKTITADWGKYTGSRVDNALIGVCNGGKLDVIDSVGGGKIVNNDTGSNAENRIFWIMTSTATKELVVNIKGGTFVQNDVNTALLYVQGNKPSDSLAPMYITISGGHFESVNTDFFNAYDGFEHTSIITGGTFDKDPTDWEIKIADGYKVEENADGTWSVVPNMIFEVHLTDANGEAHWLSPLRSNDINSALEKGKIWYDSLQGTYDFTLKILEDCEVDEPVVIDYPLTIDLCGNTVTGEEVYPVIRVQGGANVTVKNGTITNDDYVFVLGASDGTSAGNLTVESGSYTGVTTVASVTKGELTITGGEFSVKESENGSTYLLNCIDANYADGSAKITVKGGTFKGFNPADNAAENPKANFVAEGYVAETKDEGATYTVVNAVKAGYVAKIEGTYYKTVQAAVDAAAEGAQIVMIADSKENMVMLMKGVTLDLNGNTLETGYFITLHGTQVLNTKTTGILKVPQTGLSLQLTNKYIPVWNEKDGYYLVVWDYGTALTVKDGTARYMFIAKPKNNGVVNTDVVALLQDGAEDNELDIVIRLYWSNDRGEYEQKFTYNTENISTVYTQNASVANKGTMFYLDVTGYENFSSVSMCAAVIATTGQEDAATLKIVK